MSEELDRIRAEQRAAADYIAEHGYDRGAAQGASDWMIEELLYLRDSDGAA